MTELTAQNMIMTQLEKMDRQSRSLHNKLDLLTERNAALVQDVKHQIEKTTKIDKAINGNGKMGIKQEVALNSEFVNNHKVRDKILVSLGIIVVGGALGWSSSMSINVTKIQSNIEQLSEIHGVTSIRNHK